LAFTVLVALDVPSPRRAISVEPTRSGPRWLGVGVGGELGVSVCVGVCVLVADCDGVEDADGVIVGVANALLVAVGDVDGAAPVLSDADGVCELVGLLVADVVGVDVGVGGFATP